MAAWLAMISSTMDIASTPRLVSALPLPPASTTSRKKSRVTAWGSVGEGSGNLGCEKLAIRLTTVRPRLHVFGHIHDGAGFLQKGGTTYINASVCDEDYKPVNPVLMVDLGHDGIPKVTATALGKRAHRRTKA